MNSKILKLIAVAGLLAQQPSTYAGSPDGLSILVISSHQAKAHLAPVKQYFEHYRPGGTSAGCDDGSLNIGDARFASVQKIPTDLAVAAVTDIKRRKRLAKALASYRDNTHSRGFDAALVVEVNAGEMRLTGISADAAGKSYKSTLLLSSLEDPSKVQSALCRSLGELPVLEEP